MLHDNVMILKVETVVIEKSSMKPFHSYAYWLINSCYFCDSFEHCSRHFLKVKAIMHIVWLPQVVQKACDDVVPYSNSLTFPKEALLKKYYLP